MLSLMSFFSRVSASLTVFCIMTEPSLLTFHVFSVSPTSYLQLWSLLTHLMAASNLCPQALSFSGLLVSTISLCSVHFSALYLVSQALLLSFVSMSCLKTGCSLRCCIVRCMHTSEMLHIHVKITVQLRIHVYIYNKCIYYSMWTYKVHHTEKFHWTDDVGATQARPKYKQYVQVLDTRPRIPAVLNNSYKHTTLYVIVRL